MDDWEDWDESHPPRPLAGPERRGVWGAPWWALLTPPLLLLGLIVALVIRYA